jgi:hypothetical protein
MVRERIDCESLALLTDHQLQELGISKMGDRIKLLKRAHLHHQRLQPVCDNMELDQTVRGHDSSVGSSALQSAQIGVVEDSHVTAMSAEAAVPNMLNFAGGEVTIVDGIDMTLQDVEQSAKALDCEDELDPLWREDPVRPPPSPCPLSFSPPLPPSPHHSSSPPFSLSPCSPSVRSRPAGRKHFETDSLVALPATPSTDCSRMPCLEMQPTTRSADHLGSHEEAIFELVLDFDFGATVGKEEEYKQGIASDIALALDGKLDRIAVTALSAGSVVAHIVLKKGVLKDGRGPIDALEDLERQVLNPSSLLMTGRYTFKTQAIRSNYARAGEPSTHEAAAGGEATRTADSGPEDDSGSAANTDRQTCPPKPVVVKDVRMLVDSGTLPVKIEAAKEVPKPEAKKKVSMHESKELKIDAAEEAPKPEAKKEGPKHEKKEKIDAAEEAPKPEAKKEVPKHEKKEVQIDAAEEAPKPGLRSHRSQTSSTSNEPRWDVSASERAAAGGQDVPCSRYRSCSPPALGRMGTGVGQDDVLLAPGAAGERHSSPPLSRVVHAEAAMQRASGLCSAHAGGEGNMHLEGPEVHGRKDASWNFPLVVLPNNLPAMPEMPDMPAIDLPLVFPTVPPVTLPSLSLFEKSDAAKTTHKGNQAASIRQLFHVQFSHEGTALMSRKQTHATTQTSARGGSADLVDAPEAASSRPVKTDEEKDAVAENAGHQDRKVLLHAPVSVPQPALAPLPTNAAARSGKRTEKDSALGSPRRLSRSLDAMDNTLQAVLLLPTNVSSFETTKGLFDNFLGMTWAASPLKSGTNYATAESGALEHNSDSRPAKIVPKQDDETILDPGVKHLEGRREPEICSAHHQSSPPPRAVPKDAPAPINHDAQAKTAPVSPRCVLGGSLEEEELARERRRQIEAECRTKDELDMEELERLQVRELAKRIRAAQQRDEQGVEITLKSYDLFITPRPDMQNQQAAHPRSGLKRRLFDSATVMHAATASAGDAMAGVGAPDACVSGSTPGINPVRDKIEPESANTAGTGGAGAKMQHAQESCGGVAVAAADDASKAAEAASEAATRAAQEAQQHLVAGAGSLLGMLSVVASSWRPPNVTLSNPRESASGRSADDSLVSKDSSPPRHQLLQPAPSKADELKPKQQSSSSRPPPHAVKAGASHTGKERRPELESAKAGQRGLRHRSCTSSTGRPHRSQTSSTSNEPRWDVSASEWAAAGGQGVPCSRYRSCSPPALGLLGKGAGQDDVLHVCTSTQSQGCVARTALREAAQLAAAAVHYQAPDTGRGCSDEDGQICQGTAPAHRHAGASLDQEKEKEIKLQAALKQRWAGTDTHGGGHGVGGRGGGPPLHQSSPPSRVRKNDAVAEPIISLDSSMSPFPSLCVCACAVKAQQERCKRTCWQG